MGGFCLVFKKHTIKLIVLIQPSASDSNGCHFLLGHSGRFSMSSTPAAEPLFQVCYVIEWRRMLGI